MTSDPAVFAALFGTLYAAHQVGDHWGQSDHDAATKGKPGRAGHAACGHHVFWLTVTKVVAVLAVVLVTGLSLSLPAVVLGLAVDAVSHYWADRRHTLLALADLIPGRSKFVRLGAPRPGHDDAPHIGTGAYALDQSWHVGWLFIAALIIAA